MHEEYNEHERVAIAIEDGRQRLRAAGWIAVLMLIIGCAIYVLATVTKLAIGG